MKFVNNLKMLMYIPLMACVLLVWIIASFVRFVFVYCYSRVKVLTGKLLSNI